VTERVEATGEEEDLVTAVATLRRDVEFNPQEHCLEGRAESAIVL